MNEALLKCGYEVIKELGRGAGFPVYLAKTVTGDNYAAIKFLRKNESGITNPLEVDIPARLSHPHIIQNLTVLSGFKCGLGTIVVANANGMGTLPNIANEDLGVKIEIMYKVASGLAFLHENGIYHLDFKGPNIIMNGNEPQIIDFGAALQVANGYKIDYHREIITAPYRPPELSLTGGPISYYTDVWSYGITMLLSVSKLTERELGSKILQYYPSTDQFGIVPDKVAIIFGSENKRSFLEKYLTDKSLIDFFDYVIQLKPLSRPPMNSIIHHSLFEYQRLSLPVHGVTQWGIGENLSEYKYPPFFSEIIEQVCQIYYGEYPKIFGESIFVTIELLHKMVRFLSSANRDKWDIICGSCVLIGLKAGFTEIGVKNLASIVTQVTSKNIHLDTLVAGEDEVIQQLSGILYSNWLYKKATNGKQLQYLIEYIRDTNPQIYFTPEYGQNIIDSYKDDTSNKYIRIEKLFISPPTK